MKPVEALTLIAGHVSEEILLRNEYLAAENEILGSKLGKRVELTKGERIRLAKLGKKLGRKGLKGVPAIVKPETILRWYSDLVAKKFDSSKSPKRKPGRPKTAEEIEKLVVEMAEANDDWGYLLFQQV